MATYSKKMMGKEVGDADVYAEPHTMTGKKMPISSNPGKPSSMSSAETMRMSVGDFNSGKNEPTTKTTGIKIRGTGAATKGVMARGPMA
jgi:hypothetical protein